MCKFQENDRQSIFAKHIYVVFCSLVQYLHKVAPRSTETLPRGDRSSFNVMSMTYDEWGRILRAFDEM